MPRPNVKQFSSLFRSTVAQTTYKTLNSKSFITNNNLHKNSSSRVTEPLSKNPLLNSEHSEVQELLKAYSLSGGNPTLLPTSEDSNDEKSQGPVLDIPWFPKKSQTFISQQKKKVKSRESKKKWVFKRTQIARISRLKAFIENARRSVDKKESLDHIQKAFQPLMMIKELGFHLEEETYGPFFMCLIDLGMEEEFIYFSKVINDKTPNMISRLAYYEMKLWIRVDNDDKVRDLCSSIKVDSNDDNAVSYLLALCENDKKSEMLQLLEVVDLTKVSSLDHTYCVFKSLGRLLLEDIAEKLILAMTEDGADNVSFFIFNYVTSMPDYAIEDVIVKFNYLHEKLNVVPSSASYEKLIAHYCDVLQVHAALDVVDQMWSRGLSLSTQCLNTILLAVEESFELEWVHSINSMIRRQNLQPNVETYSIMINMLVKMKDFEGAYNMLTELKKMNLVPTPGMYNTIMGGYFREKNISGGLMVFNQMKSEDVKPDYQTFSYLIVNSEHEEDITKYHELMRNERVPATKHVYMSLINAYVNCGQVEKAKKVLLDEGVPVKYINGIKSVLVSALASYGQMSDALELYEEIKQAGRSLDPKAIISLIEHVQSGDELDRLLRLLGELKDPNFWFDGCGRIAVYCVKHKFLSSAVDLLKQLKDKDELSTDAVLNQVFCQIFEAEPTAIEFGLDLLKAVKEELGLRPSRTILDFLLSACVSAKDSHLAWLIWKEYQIANLPFNVLTYLRMYQVLLASGEHKAARVILKKISTNDPHVRVIIKACQEKFGNSVSVQTKKKQSPPERNELNCP